MSQAAPATTSKSRSRDTALSQSERDALDAAIGELEVGAKTWSHLTLGQRARLMERLHASVSAEAAEWADVAANSKGILAGHPLRGEDWLAGPYGVVTALDAYGRSLLKLAKGESPLTGVKTDAAPGGRVRAHVFPLGPVDGLLLSGFTGEVWFEPGVTDDEVRRAAGLAQRVPTSPAGVGLVLGAGNVSSIPVLDVLYELLAHNRVALLKLNPTHDPLAPVFERALAPLIEPGFVRIVRGGPDAGEYLTGHPGIVHVHITGAASTFDAIVWGPSAGPGAAATAKRKLENTPKLEKPITAELGGVSPIIVVPGQWTDADLRFHAEHVATMRLQNSGHNCIAGQVVLLSGDWAQRDAFLEALRAAYEAAPQRASWYPRSDEKLARAASDYPDATWYSGGTRAIVEIPAGEDADALETTEYFSPVLGVVALRGSGQEFVDAAVLHANDRLAGTLGANVLIDPATQAALGDGFERAVADLRYGSVAINVWTAFGYLTPTLTWGGFPGATLEQVESGIGVVHNALLLDHVERSVARGPFRPFPRSASSLFGPGQFSVLPKPPWFINSRTGAKVSEGFTRFQMHHDWVRLMGTLTQAFPGVSRRAPDLDADYIVVGAGSAGAALAARLTEDPAVSVLLLEAGGPDSALPLHVPAAFTTLFRGPFDWNYDTVPQPALENRTVYWPRGKTLGGSSSLNAMMWVRGFAADYDEWASTAGDGWSWKALEPYFRRVERTEAAAHETHGSDGPQSVEHQRNPRPHTAAFLDAAREAGHPVTVANLPEGQGFSQTMVSQRRGARASTADAYLRPAKRRRNLRVVTGALVRRVTFATAPSVHARAPRATGVYVEIRGVIRHARARREVILAGGAINTPQLLMLSGIGPPEHLAEHGIPLVVDAPEVGANLQDHLVAGLAPQARGGTLHTATRARQTALYLAGRRGMLSSPVAEAYGFVRTPVADEVGMAQGLPDIEIIFATAAYIGEGLVPSPGEGLTLGAILLRPRSRGTIRLASGDPTAKAVIDPGYLTDPGGIDRATLLAGLAECERLLTTHALESVTTGGWIQPEGGERMTPEERAELSLRRYSHTIYHPVGTARMGSDAASVVDPELKVRGVQGLRVADASVMPTVIRGHTNAPAIVIGEVAADLIRRGR